MIPWLWLVEVLRLVPVLPVVILEFQSVSERQVLVLYPLIVFRSERRLALNFVFVLIRSPYLTDPDFVEEWGLCLKDQR